MTEPHPRLVRDEVSLLQKLRLQRRHERKAATPGLPCTPGERVADAVAAGMGSWRFIIIQTTILVIWVILNVTAYVQHWDPYPFILLNLALSFQAAYAAPFIMMSQNRQAAIDRLEAGHDHQVNIKAELEIELLHDKIDALRATEVAVLTETVARLVALLQGGATLPATAAGSPLPPQATIAAAVPPAGER
jgi:uncharacterized membrane protein